MRALSAIFKDRPTTPQQSVVYWTEYVLRHNGTRHLRVLGKEMPLYKYLMLDALTLVLVGASTVVFFTVALTRRFCGRRRNIDRESKDK